MPTQHQPQNTHARGWWNMGLNSIEHSRVQWSMHQANAHLPHRNFQQKELFWAFYNFRLSGFLGNKTPPATTSGINIPIFYNIIYCGVPITPLLSNWTKNFILRHQQGNLGRGEFKPVFSKDFAKNTENMQDQPCKFLLLVAAKSSETSSTHTSVIHGFILSTKIVTIGPMINFAKAGAIGHPAKMLFFAKMGWLTIDSALKHLAPT